MLDILFFLFITLFFIFKLKNTIGLKDDNDIRQKTIDEFLKEKLSKNGTQTANEKVINIEQIKKKNSIKLTIDVADNVKKELTKINFNEDNFLKGSQNAVEMVNDAFSNKDIDTLKSLLSEHVFENFKKQIDTLINQNRILKSSLISFLSSKINNIYIENKTILIDVLFEMEQINFVEDKDGKVIMGNKKKIEKVKEKWVFEKKISSKDNFWIINNIENINKYKQIRLININK